MPLLIAGSLRRGDERHSFALGMLRKSSWSVGLSALGPADSELLMRSLFGDVPHMSMPTKHLHTVAEGRPRELLKLAQHLVDTRLVRYHAGSWTLPDALDAHDLPTSMLDALSEQAAGLSQGARQLFGAMAATDVQRFDFDECGILTVDSSPIETMQRLDELLTTGLVIPVEDHYTLTQAWVAALRASAIHDTPHMRRALAKVFQRRGDPFRTAHQLMLAGDEDAALDLLVAFAEESQQRTDKDPAEFAKLLDQPEVRAMLPVLEPLRREAGLG